MPKSISRKVADVETQHVEVSCGTCQFYEKLDDEQKKAGGYSKAGLCRCEPPEGSGHWPQVDPAVDWCGKHEAA